MEFIIEKIGMSRTVTTNSSAVTLCKVLDQKVCEVNENVATVAYTFGKTTNKAIQGQQKKYNLSKEFNRFVTLDVANTEAGDIDTSALVEGVKVKLSLESKGRGFSGVIKRWNFAGGPGSHGSRFHRTTGSIGNAEFPGRVMKNKKMPGQYGNKKITVKNEILSFDAQTGIVVLKGSIPGSNGSLGKLRISK
ncbi:MAG: LSU ribosomal protein L3p (L3e) [uncultured Campylobacterales bacterium]|uniref:50S ribosomal protein L3 n=1 Tax=uncultured Campylobacterales bacterium TaxID=352960 RepID=A0A6S6S911_9BACT|nr:MAG: LSU ribosomal protein L3p (L3e) [uncultured Campylobacterales bacterium]